MLTCRMAGSKTGRGAKSLGLQCRGPVPGPLFQGVELKGGGHFGQSRGGEIEIVCIGATAKFYRERSRTRILALSRSSRWVRAARFASAPE